MTTNSAAIQAARQDFFKSVTELPKQVEFRKTKPRRRILIRTMGRTWKLVPEKQIDGFCLIEIRHQKSRHHRFFVRLDDLDTEKREHCDLFVPVGVVPV